MKVSTLITDGLGYCCEWKFFSLFSNCETIADRLGVTARAVRKHKAAFQAGDLKCKDCKNCMKNRRVK